MGPVGSSSSRLSLHYEDVPPAAPADESNDSENEDENQNLSAAQRLKQREMAQMNRQTSASRNDGISATEVESAREVLF